jgi:hypothetical protein
MAPAFGYDELRNLHPKPYHSGKQKPKGKGGATGSFQKNRQK